MKFLPLLQRLMLSRVSNVWVAAIAVYVSASLLEIGEVAFGAESEQKFCN
jgi:hypothetical protein